MMAVDTFMRTTEKPFIFINKLFQREGEPMRIRKKKMEKRDERIKRERQKIKIKVKEAESNGGSNILEGTKNIYCVVCSFPILQGQAYKTLTTDAKNKEKRFYHESSCSPGSESWIKFRGEKTKMKPSKKQKNLNHGGLTEVMANVEIDFTLDLATEQIKEAIRKESSNSKEFANLLTGVKARFFSQKGKKGGWKEYVEKAVSYSYRQAQNLIKGYSDPIIREFWEELGIAKISLLNRIKKPLLAEFVKEFIPLTVSETKKVLFPKKSVMTISKIGRLLKSIRSINPENLGQEEKEEVRGALEEALKKLEIKEVT